MFTPAGISSLRPINGCFTIIRRVSRLHSRLSAQDSLGNRQKSISTKILGPNGSSPNFILSQQMEPHFSIPTLQDLFGGTRILKDGQSLSTKHLSILKSNSPPVPTLKSRPSLRTSDGAKKQPFHLAADSHHLNHPDWSKAGPR